MWQGFFLALVVCWQKIYNFEHSFTQHRWSCPLLCGRPSCVYRVKVRSTGWFIIRPSSLKVTFFVAGRAGRSLCPKRLPQSTMFSPNARKASPECASNTIAEIMVAFALHAVYTFAAVQCCNTDFVVFVDVPEVKHALVTTSMCCKAGTVGQFASRAVWQ